MARLPSPVLVKGLLETTDSKVYANWDVFEFEEDLLSVFGQQLADVVDQPDFKRIEIRVTH